MAGNPVIFTYDYEVSIGGPPKQSAQRALQAMNRAWGFEDGDCNQINTHGDIVSKPGADDPAFIEAGHAMQRYHRLIVEVSVHKNGDKSFRIKP